MKSCPNCGFDLTASGTCPVCGYSSEAKEETPVKSSGETSAGGPPARPRFGLRRRTLIVGAVGLVVLIAAGSALIAARAGASNATKASGDPAGGSAIVAQKTQPGSSAPASTQPAKTKAASSPAKAEKTTSTAKAFVPTPTDKKDYSIPVGSSPASIRATHPIDLYSPKKQPAFDITKRTSFPPLTSEAAYVKWMLAHTNQNEKFLRERWQRAQIAVTRRHITHKRILMGFLLTPREWFARPYNLSKVYQNTALPIGYGQTISGPDLVARMTDYLNPQPNQKVLEIGTGSGYQSAFLSELSNYAYTIEIVKPLAEETNQIYLKHTPAMPQYANIHRRIADGYYGWPKYAPFDRIIVTAGIDHIPPDLLKELKPNGIMVIPVGPPSGQTILKITKTVDAKGRVHLTREDIYHGYAKGIFVPFTASGGGTHDTGGTKK